MKAKLLVVEDSDAQRSFLVEQLRKRGYEVSEASGGAAAIAAVKSDPPDVVLLDVVLDDMDGHSVCRWLRADDTTRDIVVIMLTVRGEVKERVEGLHVGANDYLPKPFDMDELEARIATCLRTRKTQLDLQRRNMELEALLSETEQLAMTDPLTGVCNRRRFTDILRQEWAMAERYQHPVSVLLCDLDHFKAVNDERGHNAGDEVLRDVAQVFAGCVREVDVCARYGGDEFVVLLPHTDSISAQVVAQRIRDRLANAASGWDGAARGVRVSIGIISNEDATLKSPEELLEAADQALYEAKHQGRDRAVLSTRLPRTKG